MGRKNASIPMQVARPPVACEERGRRKKKEEEEAPPFVSSSSFPCFAKIGGKGEKKPIEVGEPGLETLCFVIL